MLKEEILSNLTKVSISSKWTVYYPNFMGERTDFTLEEVEVAEIKKALIEKIIKKNPAEWIIKEEPEMVFAGMNSRDKITILIHKSAEIKRGSYGNLEADLGKIHYQKAFTDEEWTEIESTLSNPTETNKNDDSNPLKPVLIIGGILLVITLIIYLVKNYKFGRKQN